MSTPSPRVHNNGVSNTSIIRSQSSFAVGVPSTSMSSMSRSQSSSQGNSMFRSYQTIYDPPSAKFSTSTSTQSTSNGIAEYRAKEPKPTPLRVSSHVSVDLSMDEVCIFDNIRMVCKILLCIEY